jgi:hypothetical protein
MEFEPIAMVKNDVKEMGGRDWDKMDFLCFCSTCPLRFISTASLSLTFSDTMKHHRAVVGHLQLTI